MKRRRGMIWLIVGLILAIVAAGASYIAFQQIINRQAPLEEEANQTVVVATQLINERAVIRLADITTEERPIAEIPSGAVFKTDEAVGRISTRPIMAGQVLLTQNLAESFPSQNLEAATPLTGTVNFSQALGDNLVAYAIPASNLLSREGLLLPGDHVDLLFSTDVVGQEEGVGGKVSVYALQSLEILQIIYEVVEPAEKDKKAVDLKAEPPPRIPKTLVLAVEPQDAVVLKYAIDTATPIDLVLRAADNERIFDVDAVTINTISERYEFSAPRPVR